jgi:ribosomal protein L23
MDKPGVKAEVARAFGVHVIGVQTIVGHTESRRNTKGQKFMTKGDKKAMVTLKSGEKIDIFEEAKK